MSDTRTATYHIGLDLGKKQDYTALTVLAEREARHTTREPLEPDGKRLRRDRWNFEEHWLQHLRRWELGTKYQKIASDVERLTGQSPFRAAETTLVIDRGGVGESVYEQIAGRLHGSSVRVVGVTITGGDSVTEPERRHYRVPKRDLVAALQVAVQNGEIRAAEGLDLWPVLRSEMQGFTAEITKTGHDTYEARQGEHDDLVLALAMPIWYAGYRRRKGKAAFVGW